MVPAFAFTLVFAVVIALLFALLVWPAGGAEALTG